MKDYEPRPGFVSRVMMDVRTFESSKDGAVERLLLSRPVRYAVSAAGFLLALMNIARIAFTYLSPALCK
jgi:hypothetical protein